MIRSEARLKGGNLSGALEDLNTVRSRAGLNDFMSGDPSIILDAILHERRVELFSEWGLRWLDMKRLEKVNAIMSIISIRKVVSGTLIGSGSPY